MHPESHKLLQGRREAGVPPRKQEHAAAPFRVLPFRQDKESTAGSIRFSLEQRGQDRFGTWGGDNSKVLRAVRLTWPSERDRRSTTTYRTSASMTTAASSSSRQQPNKHGQP